MSNCCCGHHHDHSHHHVDDELSQGAKLIVSALSLVCGFLISHFEVYPPAYPITDPSWVAVWICAIPIFKSAFNSLLKNRKITAAALVSSAMIGALVLQFLALAGYAQSRHLEESYIFVIGEIAFLMALGEWIEDKTVAKAQSAILSLSKLIPKRALKKVGEHYEDVCASTIAVNDILAIKPNETIPADGKIIKGSTSIDESTITGESMPLDKNIGDTVFGGTQNLSGYIEIEVTRKPNDSAISRLAKVVEEAKGKKAPISRIADKWASMVVPVAFLSSVIIFFLAKYLLGVDTYDALSRAATILIVFCPCAFVLATPTAIAAGLGNFAKRGIMVKSGAAVESLSRVTSVFFDKTGTLTKGEISVEEVFPRGVSENELLSIAASAEKFSEHPIAKAILKRAEGLNVENPDNVKSLAGIGVECDVKGEKISVTKFRNPTDDNEILESLNCGNSLIKVSRNENVIGYLSLTDTPRNSAKDCIALLKKIPCKCEMLTGDGKIVAKKIANLVGISNVRAELMPEEKLEAIRNARNNENVCMVGDGVNDAPALAESDVSIAISELKNDLAVNVADISLIGGDLKKIPRSIIFSKKIMATIKTNMTLSIVINTAAVVLAFSGILTPVFGALWHNASSVIVVLNSARLLKSKF